VRELGLRRPQRPLRAIALDQLRGLPRVEIGQPQLPLRWAVGLPELRRDHAERLTGATEQRRGLHGADAGRVGDIAV
jgi:hypothetical protein